MTNYFIGNRRNHVALLFLTGLVSACYGSAVFAHAQFTVDGPTPPRYNTDEIKTSPPCGSDASFASQRTNRKGIFVTGETVTLQWIETVNHGGSFVFDFAPANDQGFESNSIMTVPDMQNDGASRTDPHYYSQQVQLNFDACDGCTLRMRQDMENAKNYYYSCADIVIVSGNDVTPPQEVSGATASLATNSVRLTWNNPADMKGIIVLRNTTAIAAQPEDRKDYVSSDMLAGSMVVYKGTGSSFVDSNLAASTEYTYKVFAFDADYNYNSGVSTTITTAADTNTGGSTGGGSVDTGQSGGYGSNASSGGGVGYWMLIILATLLIYQRPAWKKLL
jgi:hypothetical protein